MLEEALKSIFTTVTELDLPLFFLSTLRNKKKSAKSMKAGP